VEKRKEIRQGGLCSKKGMKSDGEGCMLQSLISLFGAVEIPSFYDDPVPTNFLLISSSIESLILTLFNSVLGPKKILRIRPANLGKNPFRGRNPCFHTKYSNGNILSF
jgi:hypothetical protein